MMKTKIIGMIVLLALFLSPGAGYSSGLGKENEKPRPKYYHWKYKGGAPHKKHPGYKHVHCDHNRNYSGVLSGELDGGGVAG